MSIKAPGYNVSTGPAAGFVKNDASGNFLFGQAGGAGAGAGLELIETKVIGADTNTLIFSGLNGDVDKVYKLFYHSTGGATSSNYMIRPNGQVAGAGGSVHNTLRTAISANFATNRFQYPQLRFGRQTTPRVHGGELTFYAESGRIRVYNAYVNSTSPLGTVGVNRTTTETWHGSWEDGAGNTINITSLELHDVSGVNAYLAGSVWSLFKVKV